MFISRGNYIFSSADPSPFRGRDLTLSHFVYLANRLICGTYSILSLTTECHVVIRPVVSASFAQTCSTDQRHTVFFQPTFSWSSFFRFRFRISPGFSLKISIIIFHNFMRRLGQCFWHNSSHNHSYSHTMEWWTPGDNLTVTPAVTHLYLDYPAGLGAGAVLCI